MTVRRARETRTRALVVPMLMSVPIWFAIGEPAAGLVRPRPSTGAGSGGHRPRGGVLHRTPPSRASSESPTGPVEDLGSVNRRHVGVAAAFLSHRMMIGVTGHPRQRDGMAWSHREPSQ